MFQGTATETKPNKKSNKMKGNAPSPHNTKMGGRGSKTKNVSRNGAVRKSVITCMVGIVGMLKAVATTLLWIYGWGYLVMCVLAQ